MLHTPPPLETCCKACWDSTHPRRPAARHAGIPPAIHAGIHTPSLETCCKACWDTSCNACWDTHPPPVNRMTNRCKNITLATTSLRPVTTIQYVIRKLKRCYVTQLEGIFSPHLTYTNEVAGHGEGRSRLVYRHGLHLVTHTGVRRSFRPQSVRQLNVNISYLQRVYNTNHIHMCIISQIYSKYRYMCRILTT